jgi:hypothetical protein
MGTSLENFASPIARNTFKEFVDFTIEEYCKNGVNLIIEGVQIDTERLFTNSNVLGGVILQTSKTNQVKWGKNPPTHFKREMSTTQITKVNYEENKKFKKLNNNLDFKLVITNTYEHLNELLDTEMKLLRPYGRGIFSLSLRRGAKSLRSENSSLSSPS